MRRSLVLARLFVGPEGLLLGLLLALVLVIDHHQPFRGLGLPLAVAITLAVALVGMRIVRFGTAPLWRTLPGGDLTFARALAILTVACSVVFGGLAQWADIHGNIALPYGHVILPFIILSFASFVLLLARGERLPRLLFYASTVVLFALTSFLHFMLVRHPESLWRGALAWCFIGWVIALTRAPRYSSPRERHGPLTRLLDSGRSRAMSIHARVLLALPRNYLFMQSPRRGLAPLSVALLLCLGNVVVMFVLFPRSLLGGLLRAPAYRDMVLLAAWPVALSAAFIGSAAAARARSLWLLQGDSRADSFRAAERATWINLVVLGTATWAAVALCARRRHLDIPTPEFFAMWGALCACGLWTSYAGLTRSALVSRLARWLWRLFTYFIFLFSPRLWIATFAGLTVGTQRRTVLLVIAVATLLVLRAIAMRKWRGIDWTRLRGPRSIPRPN